MILVIEFEIDPVNIEGRVGLVVDRKRAESAVGKRESAVGTEWVVAAEVAVREIEECNSVSAFE